jgi:hypothetical protein
MAFVPDTNHGLCSWHKPRPLFLAQTTAFVPGTNHGLCSWHKPRLLFLAQITTFVPGTNPRPLFLTQITAFVPGTNHGLCSRNKPTLAQITLAQTTRFNPTRPQPKPKKRNTTCPLNKLCFYPLLQAHILTWVYRIRFGCIPCTYMKFKV